MTLVLLAANVLNVVFGVLMFLSALFLILLVLVQRGRGGGLTGALGGMGGRFFCDVLCSSDIGICFNCLSAVFEAGSFGI